MSTATPTTTTMNAAAIAETAGVKGTRKNGKQWKPTKTQFRPGMKSARPTFEQRQAERTALAVVKAREKEMKDEKLQKKRETAQAAKERRERAEEKARYEKLAERMHRRRLDRLKRREKRNKALKER